MLVQIEPKAQEYIQQKGKNVMLILGNMRGCCGGVSSIPKIYLGLPKDLQRFEEKKIGNIIIFIDKNLRGVEKIRVSYTKFLWLNKLSVEIE